MLGKSALTSHFKVLMLTSQYTWQYMGISRLTWRTEYQHVQRGRHCCVNWNVNVCLAHLTRVLFSQTNYQLKSGTFLFWSGSDHLLPPPPHPPVNLVPTWATTGGSFARRTHDVITTTDSTRAPYTLHNTRHSNGPIAGADWLTCGR